jgi:predicted O-methyltransferase YrrM
MYPNWFKDVCQFFEAHVPQVPLRVLQIGTYTGDATEWLLNNREVERLDEVDTWLGSDAEQHRPLDFQSVEAVYDSRFKDDSRVTKHKMTSDMFFANKPTSSYNFIYIDGDHTALQTALDGLNAFKLLEVGGIIAFDDYGWGYGGKPFLEPKRGVDAFMSICEGEVKCIAHGYQVWFERLL